MHCRSVGRFLALGFVAMAFACTQASAQVLQFGLFYSLYYNQDGHEPEANPSSLYTTPLLAVTNESDLDSVRLTVPGWPGDANLARQDTNFYLTQSADDEAEMLADFPAGEYLFWGEGGTLGSFVVSFFRPETALWSYEVPAFSPSTYDASRQIDPAADFTFEFNSWDSDPEATQRAGMLYIYDYSGANPFFYTAYFSNSDTQHTIPAGTLPAGTHLVAQLYFSSRVATNVDSAISLASFDRATAMQVYTSGEPPLCLGDLNFDGVVDDADFVDFVFAYNILDCADPFMPMDCPADLNFDGFVDDFDFVIFVGAYNELICPKLGGARSQSGFVRTDEHGPFCVLGQNICFVENESALRRFNSLIRTDSRSKVLWR